MIDFGLVVEGQADDELPEQVRKLDTYIRLSTVHTLAQRRER